MMRATFALYCVLLGAGVFWINHRAEYNYDFVAVSDIAANHQIGSHDLGGGAGGIFAPSKYILRNAKDRFTSVRAAKGDRVSLSTLLDSPKLEPEKGKSVTWLTLSAGIYSSDSLSSRNIDVCRAEGCVNDLHVAAAYCENAVTQKCLIAVDVASRSQENALVKATSGAFLVYVEH